MLATAKETDLIVCRKLCNEAEANLYRERVASASTPAEWGKMLRWCIGHSNDRPTVMVVNRRVISNTERVGTYLATQAFCPTGAQEGSRLAWPGSRLPPERAAKLADLPSDDELKDAFFSATSNTPGPDGVPLHSSDTAGSSFIQLPGLSPKDKFEQESSAECTLHAGRN